VIRELIYYPDKRLETESSDVDQFDGSLDQFIQDMKDTMYASNGVGISAIQLGRPLKIFIIANIPDIDFEERVFINPHPTTFDKNNIVEIDEGCLSMPGYMRTKKRSQQIIIMAKDARGENFDMSLSGLPAIVAQHEMDHLVGKHLLSKTGVITTMMAKKTIRKGIVAEKRARMETAVLPAGPDER